MKIVFVILLISLKVSAAIDIMPPYAQGTWTPIFFLSTSQPTTVTYSSQVGDYTKIGNRVCITGYVALSAFTAGSGAGNVYVSGTPFAVSGTTVQGGGGVTITTKNNWVTNGPDFAQTLSTGSNGFELVFDANTTITNNARATITTNTTVGIEGCYITNQ